MIAAQALVTPSTANLAELEKQAELYAKARAAKSSEEANAISKKLIDSISSPDFVLSLEEKALTNNGITTYLYLNNASYPALFSFIAEILHAKVPIEIRAAKFGPAEILVRGQSKPEADAELAKSVSDLRNLVHAKRSEMSHRH